MPKYKYTSFTGETIVLENGNIKLIMYKRLSGWGFGEIYTPDGKLMAVLDHLGELMVRDQEIPMRIEAREFIYEEKDSVKSLVFNVASMNVQGKLDGTSFGNWMHYPFTRACLEGEVRITLDKELPIITMTHNLKAQENMYVRYIRGPWLKVGEGSFGIAKDSGILPGVEWLDGSEWSSGSDWFKEPWASKYVPHPNKVSIPCMAISHDGVGIGLSWNPVKWSTRWFNYRKHFPQPVFAAPNFIERMNNNLMGLMVPSVNSDAEENGVFADPPLEMHLDQMVRFESQIFLVQGNALDVITDWVARNGLPEVEHSTEYYHAALDRIATAYNTNLWKDNTGFGNEQDKYKPHVPGFLRRYVDENQGSELAAQLTQKITWCDSIKVDEPQAEDALIKRAELVLTWQKADGSFQFEPDGRHKTKDDFIVAREFAEPMGLAFDTALDMCVTAATELIDLGVKLSTQKYLDAARKALDFAMPMMRPEGGDFWETPLHAPNLLAAGHAAISYYEAYRVFGEEKYKNKAIYWIRSLLPFTHLWEPENIPMLYNTKPCLCSSDWYFANWVRDHVQWEVLQTFNSSVARKIDWSTIDEAIDWKSYHRGITSAAIRWMSDYTKENWMPHNLPKTYPAYLDGKFDCCFPDTFNCTTGNYGGMLIMPGAVADNIYGCLG